MHFPSEHLLFTLHSCTTPFSFFYVWIIFRQIFHWCLWAHAKFKKKFLSLTVIRIRKFGLGRQHTFSLRWYFNFLLSCVLSHISIQYICQRKIKFNYPRKPTNISQRSGNIQKEEVKLSKGWNQRLLCVVSWFLFWINW